MFLCFHGTDAYRLSMATEDLVVAMRAQHGNALHVETLDCSDEGASDELERQLKYPSFFGEHKLIIARNAADPVIIGLLGRFSLNTLGDITLVAVQHTTGKRTDTKSLKALISAAHTAEKFEPLTGTALTQWMVNYCKERGTSITADAVRELTGRIPTDAGLLAQELEKLCSYAQNTPISPDMVRLLTAQRTERSEWELSNALSVLDKRATLTALWRKLQEGTAEHMLIGSLASGLRNLIVIKDLTARHQSPAGIAKLTGLHPFVISKTLRGAMSADTQRLTDAHIALARLDRDFKDGLEDATDGMFSIVLSL